MEGFRFINHTADIAVEVYAESVEKLFYAASEAWKSSVLENTVSDSPFELHIELEAKTIEELLVDFLSELNFILFARRLVFSKIKHLVIENNSDLSLKSVIYFEDFNPSKHTLKAEIKAVTFHQVNMKFDGKLYRTKLVFDI